jgi:hypothetical protein
MTAKPLETHRPPRFFPPAGDEAAHDAFDEVARGKLGINRIDPADLVASASS